MLNQKVFRYLQQESKTFTRWYWGTLIVAFVFAVSIIVFWIHWYSEPPVENARDVYSPGEITAWYEDRTAVKLSEISESQFVDVKSVPEIYDGIVPVDITKLDPQNMIIAVLRPEISMRYMDRDYTGVEIPSTSNFELKLNGMTIVGTTLQGNVENIKAQIPMQDDLLQDVNGFYETMSSVDSGFEVLKTRDYGGVRLLIVQKENIVYGVQIDEFQKTITISRGLEQ